MRKAIEVKSQVVSEIVEKLQKSSSAIVVTFCSASLAAAIVASLGLFSAFCTLHISSGFRYSN